MYGDLSIVEVITQQENQTETTGDSAKWHNASCWEKW